MKKKSELYFEPTDYNREGCTYCMGDSKNFKKEDSNRKQKQRLIAKKNIKLKK